MKKYLSDYWHKQSYSLPFSLKDCLRYSKVKYLLVTYALIALFISSWQTKAVAGENFFKVTFDPPAGDKPQTTKGGASRSIGECIQQAENSDLPLSPLLPSSAKGLTIASHPTVLAYIPHTSAHKVLFSWRDENGNDHYQTILPIKNQAGIISLTLPEDAPSLEIGQNYQWALAVMCDDRLQPDSPIIQGEIERVALEPTLRDRLETATPLESAALYGEASIWYETVATLAQLKAAQPSDRNLASNWEELLTSVGLKNIAKAPLIK